MAGQLHCVVQDPANPGDAGCDHTVQQQVAGVRNAAVSRLACAVTEVICANQVAKLRPGLASPASRIRGNLPQGLPDQCLISSTRRRAELPLAAGENANDVLLGLLG